jgi:hypothetical protein
MLQEILTAGMLRDGTGIHCQHDEASRVCGLRCLAEKRNRVRRDVGSGIPLQAQVVLARQLYSELMESDFVPSEKRLYRSEVVQVPKSE